MKGKTIVEQVDLEGNIVDDYDTSISIQQLFSRIKEHFPKITKSESGMICGEYEGHKYSIRTKNITYLGNPHPHFKKRIQIPDDLQKFYKESLEKGMFPILLGVYTYNDNILFCDFNIEDFIYKKAHNSSAHVYVSDLVEATVDGIFQKIDYFGNKITVFRPDVVTIFLEDMFQNRGVNIDIVKKNNNCNDYVHVMYDIEEQNKDLVNERIVNYSAINMPVEIKEHIFNFFRNERKIWNGIECYKEMIKNNYRNKFQPEWAGFYLEYEFERYLLKNNLTNLITYAQDKKSGGIDLDLYFPTIQSYGDLKAHSDKSRGIQGNDWDTILNIINSKESNNHVYYIVCEHSTQKDSNHNYRVTQFWNQVQNKRNLMSYSSRMKYSIELKKMYILDINSENKEYLTMFKQGVNSNGKLRAPKIMIEQDNISHFIIAELIL